MYNEKEFDNLTYLFFRLVQSQANEDIPQNMSWKNDAQVLSVKIFRHIASVKHLSSGLRFEFKNEPHFEYIDHSTITIITRAAFESYLAFNYIYINPDEQQSHFRHKTWQIAGLIDRGKLRASTQEAKELQANESKEIETLKQELSVSPFFQRESEKTQKKILADRWRPEHGWGEMAEKAGFHRVYFDNIYNHLSGHSHASFISAIQTRDAREMRTQQDMADAMKQICCVIMSHFSFAYVKLFPRAALILNTDKDLYNLADKWHIRTEDMSRIYGAT